MRRLPLIVLIVAVLLTGTLFGAKQLLDDRTASQPLPTTAPGLAQPVPPLVAVRGRAPTPTAAGLSAALRGLLTRPALGSSLGVQVVDAISGRELYGDRANASGAPASTAKLATAVASLHTLDADAVLETRAVLGTAVDDDTVVLVGGGDPTLTGPDAPPPSSAYPRTARIADLAAATAARLRERGISTVTVAVDDRLFVGPTSGPGWKPNYIPEGSVSPVTALSVDGGRLHPDADDRTPDVRSTDPPLTAGRVFATLLAGRGIKVQGAVTRARPSPDTRTLATVSSPPIAALVVRMLQRSDNELAEALLRHIAIAERQQPSFSGGAAAMRTALGQLGLDTHALQLVDGSGLSTRDRVTPRALAGLLRVITDPGQPAFRPALEGLPVAAFSGTLTDRYRLGDTGAVAGHGAGTVRAKTGTLTGVSSLAGLVVDADGRLLLFALLADAVPPGGGTAAQEALDSVAARLAVCGCR